MTEKYILTIDCPEKIGIVHAVTGFFTERAFSVTEASEFTDTDKGLFFARWEFSSADADHPLPPVEEVRDAFAPIAERFEMNWQLKDSATKPRILIAVSRYGHCLNDLLYRWKEESFFPGEIVGVVSNHEDYRDKVGWYGLPYYYLPVTPETKHDQEQQILSVMKELDVDLLVLARYMQILSDEMCQELEGRAINIHHSFLPSFKGAKPYQQAYERGVKISGATAHYVTSDLDEGPIIEQDVQRVEHKHGPDLLARLGKNIENLVLARAIYWHCHQRIVIEGNRTIVFK